MGGQTIRVLAQLLENGDREEINSESAKSGNINPLFTGGKNWIYSITTLATPEDGSPLAHIVENGGTFFYPFLFVTVNNNNLNKIII